MFNLEMFAPFIFFHMTNATIIKSATKHARTIIYSNDEPVKPNDNVNVVTGAVMMSWKQQIVARDWNTLRITEQGKKWMIRQRDGQKEIFFHYLHLMIHPHLNKYTNLKRRVCSRNTNFVIFTTVMTKTGVIFLFCVIVLLKLIFSPVVPPEDWRLKGNSCTFPLFIFITLHFNDSKNFWLRWDVVNVTVAVQPGGDICMSEDFSSPS